MLALLLTAAISAQPAPSQDVIASMRVLGANPAACSNQPTQVVDQYWRPVPSPLNRSPRALQAHPLSEEPTPALELAVDRKLNGCRVRTVVAFPQGAVRGPASTYVITPAGEPGNRR